MNFISLVIICIVFLIGYYLFLLFTSEKTTDFDSSEYDFEATDYYLEEPIEVTIDMVTYKGAADLSAPESPQKESAITSSSMARGTIPNQYETPTNRHKNDLFDIASYLDASAIQAAELTFAGVHI